MELDWSLVGLWMIQLFAVKEQIKVARPPDGSSVSLSLAIIQDAMNLSHEAALNGRVLSRQLSEAVKDQYVRTSSKSARYQANKKDKPSATQPILLKATASVCLKKSLVSCGWFNAGPERSKNPGWWSPAGVMAVQKRIRATITGGWGAVGAYVFLTVDDSL